VRGLLWVVTARPISSTIVVGSVAAAATSGALLAIGRRLGSALLPFAFVGAVPLHQATSVAPTAVVVIGLVLHLATIFVWSAIALFFARVGARRGVAAAIVSVMQFTLSWIVASSTGRGLSSALVLGDRVVYAVVLACALVVGMRFAFLRREMHDERYV
jgi:hypothetical protein